MMFEYKVKESTVIVSGRPKKLTQGPDDFADTPDVDAFLSVTDTWVVPCPNKIFVWLPWNEGRNPSHELWYSANKTLIWWIHYQKLKKINVFCDAGTHRSVSVFGAFLTTYFDRHEREKIVQERVALQKYDYTEEQLARYAHPLQYIESYLDRFPEDRLLFKAMKGDYMGRLDGFTHAITRLCQERFADRNEL
jgi:hypothetical protein